MQVIGPYIEGRDRQVFRAAIVSSIILHLLLIFLPKSDFFKIDIKQDIKKPAEAVTIIFPENKPMKIVDNINENNLRPDNSDLLSEQDSRARNPELFNEFGTQPFSSGSSPFENLSNPEIPLVASAQSIKKFKRNALSKDALNSADPNTMDRSSGAEAGAAADQYYPDQNYAQKKFSADELGDISLSTYAWEWAPYINAMKRKLYQVWSPPVAYYYLGLIHGYTVIQFSISKDGRLLWYKVLEQQGHESLQQSSVNAIVAIFPFKSLPANFPEDQLTIIARLFYPNPREVVQ
jgi:hypothetical protein